MSKSDFITFFSTENQVNTRLVRKDTSILMKFLKWCLKITDGLSITAIGDFSKYSTTVGRTIYTSQVIIDQCTGMDAHPVPSPHILHELTHVLMWSPAYAIRYLLSKSYRIEVEVACFLTEMSCSSSARSVDYVNSRAGMLMAYGVAREDALTALLAMRAGVQCETDVTLWNPPQGRTGVLIQAARDVCQTYKRWLGAG